VRAKYWGEYEAVKVFARLDGRYVPLKQVKHSRVWQAKMFAPDEGVYSLLVSFEDNRGRVATDEIRVVIGERWEHERAERDQENALEAWPEHGLLGTQLGPNKNGKKW